MPLAFASLISGMMTLVATTPNIIVNGILRERGAGRWDSSASRLLA